MRITFAAYAEQYVFDDPNTSILKVRQLIENLARNAAARAGRDVTAGGVRGMAQQQEWNVSQQHRRDPLRRLGQRKPQPFGLRRPRSRAERHTNTSRSLVCRTGTRGSAALGSRPVLATFDAPLGVPESYLAAVARLPGSGPPTTFMELLKNVRTWPRFVEATSDPAHWTVERPFFAVPAGAGSLTAYRETARSLGVNLYREIDKATGAKTMFVKSGIPGSVGSATCALWQELAAQLATGAAFKVWPFDGTLEDLLQTNQIIVGEIYPRAAYGTALLDHPIQERARLAIAKTKVQYRLAAIANLQAADWVRALDVSFENLAEAEANEDDFDACFTATALLRCVLENIPLTGSMTPAAIAEGGMLGTGSVNFSLPEKAFSATDGSTMIPERRIRDDGTPFSNRGVIRCPIAGCEKIYANGRLGWDAHVGSLKMHPLWRRDLMNGEDRRRHFKDEFPDFFS